MSKIQKIYDYLKECNGFFFASCDGDKPRVRPFGFMMIFEDKLYFGMGTHKESYKQVKANPNVEICAMNPDGSFIRDDAGNDLRGDVARNADHIEADGTDRRHGFKLCDGKRAALCCGDHAGVFTDRDERAGKAANV